MYETAKIWSETATKLDMNPLPENLDDVLQCCVTHKVPCEHVGFSVLEEPSSERISERQVMEGGALSEPVSIPCSYRTRQGPFLTPALSNHCTLDTAHINLKRSNTFLRNVGFCLESYTVSEPRMPQSEDKFQFSSVSA
jgi:hypothetical protein